MLLALLCLVPGPAASHTIPVAPYPAVPGTLSTPGTPVQWCMTKPPLFPCRSSCLWANNHLGKLCTVRVPRAMQTTEQMEIAPIQTFFHTWHFITLQICSSRGTGSTSLPSRSTLHPLPNVLQQQQLSGGREDMPICLATINIHLL